MAKRFSDTNKYKKPFIRSLPGAYKLFWDFICLDCDNAGIWIVDFTIAQTYVGDDMPIDKKSALFLFNEDEVRIIELDGGKKWFIPSFIEFQYGQLSEKNRAHISAISTLKKFGLLTDDLRLIIKNKGVGSPLQEAKEQEQDKDKEKEQGVGGLGEGFSVHLELELPEMVLESAERNQFVHTKSKNTDFVKDQWVVFLSERINSPPAKLKQYQSLNDLTDYFLNWIRPKFPKNGSHQQSPSGSSKQGTSAARTDTLKGFGLGGKKFPGS